MLRFAPLCALVLLAACDQSVPPAGNRAEAARPAATVPLTIRSATGVHRFDVEVARTPQEQEKGLMFRNDLARDGGMLFPMTPPRTASFWMKDTLIPLDMLFIRTDGTIAFIGANAQPYDRTPVSAGIPVAAVLELRGGRAAELGVATGDRVAWGACAVGAATDTDEPGFCPDAGR